VEEQIDAYNKAKLSNELLALLMVVRIQVMSEINECQCFGRRWFLMPRGAVKG
jgi:hypothetical protein